MTPFQDFELEYYQSQHEHNVELNLADSSVKCVGMSDWLEPEETAELLATGLFYPQVNGTTALRTRIADLYPGAGPDNVLVTVGASQANALVCATLAEPGDEVVVLTPGYRQVWGLARNAGCVVRDLPLDPQSGWRVDLAKLDEVVGPKTKLVALVNPNNPTGSILTETEMERIIAACARVGAWLHADEVYHGTEITAKTPISFWGRYDRLICTNSLSKAYGLSGLRIGWALASPETIEALWRRHEYGVIAAAAPSMTLATIALAPAKRQFLLERQRGLSLAGRKVFAQWMLVHGKRFSVQGSFATSLAFVRYDLPIGSYELAERIRKEASVLVAPGATMGAEQHLRITLGYEPEKVREALDRIGAVAAAIARA